MSNQDTFEYKYNEEIKKTDVLQEEIDKLRKQNESEHEAFQDGRSQKDIVIGELEQVNQTIAQYKKEMEVKRKDNALALSEKVQIIENQQDDMKSLNDALKENKIVIKSLNAEKSQLQREILVDIKTINRLKAQLDELIKKWNYCRTHHKEREIAAQKERVKLLQEKINDFRKKNDDLNAKLNFLRNDKSRILNLKEQIMKKDNQLSEASKDNKALKKQLEEFRQNLREKDNMEKELQKELRDRNEKVRLIGQKITSLRVRAKDIETENAKKEKEINETRQKIEDLSDQTADYQMQLLKTSRRNSASFVYI